MSAETSVRQALTDIATAAASADELARLLWTQLHCTPEDTDTRALWLQLPATVRRQFGQLANTVREHLERVEAWRRPRRWESVLEIPTGVMFTPVDDDRKFRRVGEWALALPPAAPIRYHLGAMDATFRDGYREVIG